MSNSRHTTLFCGIIAALTLALTLLLSFAKAAGAIGAIARTLGYEAKLFDTSYVHSIDIVMDADDWQSFLDTAESEGYAICSVTIDGETVKNCAIRAKGNTSLSNVKQYGNDRYSFKIEFDHYDDTLTYHGLDKLLLNNNIQDNTLMKDYLTYRMMAYMGVDAPLVSYAFITVNGEDFGLYLALEAVEESFLERNYGADYAVTFLNIFTANRKEKSLHQKGSHQGAFLICFIFSGSCCGRRGVSLPCACGGGRKAPSLSALLLPAPLSAAPRTAIRCRPHCRSHRGLIL